MAREQGIPEADVKECAEMFIVNSKFLGVLKPISGAERIISIEQALEELPTIASGGGPDLTYATAEQNRTTIQTSETHNWDRICFYISPIGEEGMEHRQHADLFLGSIVEPSLEEFGLSVVRADKIGKPGMTTAQIIEHILRSKLVIADLSYHNPNVFYELCLRHVCRTHCPD